MSVVKSPYELCSDLELFHFCQKNDATAFEMLYDRYKDSLTVFAKSKLQCRQKAEDIVQDVFISLYQRRNEIEFTTSVKAYLFQALRFKISNEIRSLTIRRKYQEYIFFSPYCKNDFAVRVEEKELYRKIIQTLDSLPEKCMQVFILSRTKNLSHKAISDGLSISVSTVEKHISKALKTFRANLINN